MKKLIILICLLTALFPKVSARASRAVEAYDAAAAKVNAQNDLANWMSYLPDDVFVAHLSIPGSHDTATAHNVSEATTSQTQTATLDDQLAGGLRAFDFRPGLSGSGSNQYLNCNHGVSTTDLTLEQAFTKLTDYLDAHPNEFFIIHLFRGNVYSTNPGFPTNLVAKYSDADKQKYNELFDAFFNKGKFNNYIVDYSPYLKVKDMRGKMVIFRRDRIDFAHIAKAGNLSGWPADDEAWSEASRTTVTNASDPTVRGQVTVTDVSSPNGDNERDNELNSITNINAWARTQVRPNEAKRAGSYKPTWVMCFTSGALDGENRNGYAKNATYTNPHLTQLIQNSDVKGPVGIIFSDWVLTDTYGNYDTKGVDLIPTIINNNFDYISEFILDDELFAQVDVESYWENGKQYFMRNAGTGNFLSAGEWWGTHAALNKYGIKVSPVMEEDGSYTINTTLNTGGGLGNNMYVDNTDDHARFTVTHVGGGKFVFTKDGKNLAAESVAGTQFQDDGTTHNVDMVDANNEDPNQQWELLEIEQYFEDAIAQATPTNGVDVSYRISGHRFFGNDTENGTWAFATSNQGKCDNPGGGDSDHQRVLRMYNEDRHSRTPWNSGWTLTKEVTGLPNGIYNLKWDAYAANITDETMTINGEVFVDEYSTADGHKVIKRGSVTPTSSRSGNIFSGYTYTYSMDMATAVSEMDTGDYRCSIDLNIKDGKLTIEAAAPTHSSPTAFLLDNFTLTYYGPDPAAACDFLAKVIEDTEDRMANLTESQREGWDDVLQPYRLMVEEKTVVGDGTTEAYEIYGKLREHLQKFADVEDMNMTGAIINPNFELGTGFGWSIVNAGDTGVRENAGEYAMSVNTDDKAGAGSYLFHTEQNGRGTVLSQTIPGLPAGHYRLIFTVGNDAGQYMWVNINGLKKRTEQPVLGDGSVGNPVTFEFDVAENTEEVTISICGANNDGSWDDFGGNWYKVDNIRLFRHGEVKVCDFYDRLDRAITRFSAIADALPDKYSKQWNPAKYRQFYIDHINSGHASDPMDGSNGLKEIEEMYAELRALVLSQTEEGADMSGAILNHSFELGDMTGWTCEMDPQADTKVTLGNQEDVYKTDGLDGNYLFNSWLESGTCSAPVYQTLTGLPAGRYRLSALVASDEYNQFYLAVNGQPGEAITTTGAATFVTGSVEFEVLSESDEVMIGLYPAINGRFSSDTKPETMGQWFKVDDFSLTLLGKDIDIEWNWTYSESVYDTLILPFDAEIPEGMEVYESNDVDASVQSSDYHVLVLDKMEKIAANTPYVVKRMEESPAPAARTAAVRNGGYVFTGSAVNNPDQDTYTKGLLTGTLGGVVLPDGGYAMSLESDKHFFVRYKQNIDGVTVPANHAYIANASAADKKDVMYLENYPDLTPTGVEAVAVDGELTGEVDVYTAAGVIVRRGVEAGNALEGLPRGIYIITDGRNTVKSLK